MPLYFANTEAAATEGNLFTALGLDVKLFIVQLVAFLIVFAILRKFVWPPLMKALDERQKKIDESVKAAETAQKAAEEAEAATEKNLDEARKEAADIVALARKEAAALSAEAEDKAAAKAAHIVEQAEARIEQSVTEARAALRSETLQLVREATEKVLSGVMTDKLDDKLIARAIDEVKKS